MSDNLQKLGALAFALVAITASVTAISNTLSPESRILIPILGNESVLSGQVSTSSIPINDYTASQTAASVIIKADEHNFVTCNNGGSVGTRIHDFGRVPTWAYEFTGNEPPFTGDFWVSPGELASNPQYNSINTLNTFKEGKRYYIMSAKDLRYQCGEGLKLSEYCGDSICQNSEDTNSCNEDCNQCGDGVVGGLEACDDGNSLDQDGCNAYCQAEPGYGCTGNPSDCNLLIPTLPGQGGSSSPGSSSSTSTSQAQTCTYSPIGSKDDVFVKGTATFNGQSSTDFCVSDTVLAEYSCSFGFMEGLTHNCEFGCADGACNRPPDDIASLRISIDGPQSTTYLPGTQNAVLGKVNFEKGGSPMNIENLFILVQGTTEDFNALNGRRSSSTDEIHEILEGVELYNMTTGESKAGSRLTGSQSMGHKTTGSDKGTYQIYRFDNIVVNQNSEDWEFRTDFQENITNGDKFRINICGEPTHVAEGNNVIRSFTKCDFGGLIDPVTTYQLRVIDDTTGNLISTIFPRGNIASNFHTVFDGSGGNPGPGPGPSGSPGNPGPGPETHTECRDSQCVVVSGLGNDQCSSSSDCSDLVPKAFITQKATGTSNTATENQKDISLLRFEAFASSEDLLIAKAEFEEQQGDLRDLQNYALWVDTDGNNLVDTILEDGVTFQGGRISFGNLAGGGYVLPANQAIAFEVHGDVSSSLSEDKIQLRFEIGLDDYLHLEALDDGENLNGIKTDDGACRGGVSGGCDITVSTVDSIVWNFSSQGSLFVTKDNTPLRQRQLLGGELGAEVLRLEFHAEDEDIDVT
ncbi:MAG: hypothetical protein HOM42_02950, partial [Candidatus Peribacter sp.]|nr:hypothetical protein [Candidatus Peribacter sp.]